VTLQFLESSVYTPRYANGDFDMAVNAWGKSLEADSVITGLRWLSENSKFYGNPQVDAAIAKARATFGMPERTLVYQEADRLLREDAVGLFTHAQSGWRGTNRGTGSRGPTPATGAHYYVPGLMAGRAPGAAPVLRRPPVRAGAGPARSHRLTVYIPC
jgi:ABC-type transport system substrate-binding protein